jgi:hypothetical protein
MGDDVSQVHPEAGRDIAHKYTNYTRWRTADEIFEVRYQMPYEPYFVANKSVPRYDTRFVGYGNDKTGQCLEVHAAGMRYRVLPRAFVFHVSHPFGEWQLTDEPWVVRSPRNIQGFLRDVHARYGLGVAGAGAEAAVQVQPATGRPGESCTSACEQRGLGCREDLTPAINTCEAMIAAFGERCRGDGCINISYGNDLPSLNTARGMCLLNSRLDQFPMECDRTHGTSARLCPCGDRLERWLTAEYVVSTLSKEGKWKSVSPSLTSGPPV